MMSNFEYLVCDVYKMYDIDINTLVDNAVSMAIVQPAHLRLSVMCLLIIGLSISGEHCI